MTELWLTIISLILFNGFIGLSEATLAASKRAKLEPQLKKGSVNARFVLENHGRQSSLHHRLQFFSLALSFSIALFSVALWHAQHDWLAGSFGESQGQTDWKHFLVSVSLSIAPVFFLMHLFSQVLPARFASFRPEKTAVFLSPFIRIINRLAVPLVWFNHFISNLLLRMIGLPQQNGEAQVTEDEVIDLIAQGTSSGTIEEVEQNMLERVLLLGDRNVASLMTNRIEMEWIDLQDSAEEILRKIVDSNHSLFPVCEGELDRVAGILNSKKYLIAAQTKKNPPLKSLLETARIVPENMKALTALEEFKASKTKMAVVVDEYGSVQGLLTQSDLFESIVAEHDLPDEENEVSIVQRDESSFLIDALLPFEEFLQYFEIEDVEAEDRSGFHSLGGFILHLSKQIPSTGQKFTWKNFEFEVVDMDGNRIDKVLLSIQPINQEH